MEEKLVEQPVMNEKEFKEYLENKVDSDFKNGILHLHSYEAVNKFKSIRRAIKRGNASPYGEIYPKRPFNNRHGNRSFNTLRKNIYGELNKYREKERV